MLLAIERSTLSSNDVPSTTKNVPKKMIRPTITVFTLWEKRLRMESSVSSLKAEKDCMGHRPSGDRRRRLRLAEHAVLRVLARIDHLAVLEAHDAARVVHHAVVVRREDERRLIAVVHVAHQIDDVLTCHGVQVGGRL